MRALLALLLLLPLAGRAQTYADYRAHLEFEEGVSTTIYQDAGHPAIGLGHRVLKHERFKTPLSARQIDVLFIHDLGVAIGAAKAALPSFDLQPPKVKMVVVGLGYNTGRTGLRRFKRLLQRLEEMDYAGAASELRNSLYAKQLPDRAYRYMETLEIEAARIQLMPVPRTPPLDPLFYIP